MAEENEDLLSKVGIEINSDKINIDINKIKEFFTTMQSTLQSKAESIEQNISEGKVDMAESVGIKVDKEHIDIDLAKTKSFIEDLGKRMEGFVGEIDKAVDRIGTSDTEQK